MGRPKGSRNGRRTGPTHTYGVRLERHVAAAVEALAAREGIPVAAWIRRAVLREAGVVCQTTDAASVREGGG